MNPGRASSPFGPVRSKSKEGADVQQKNWPWCELVGYRYDTNARLRLLNAIWDLDSVYTDEATS
jgi:hypothetical protein